MGRYLARYEQVTITDPETGEERVAGFRPVGVKAPWSSFDLRPYGIDGAIVSQESQPDGSIAIPDDLNRQLPGPARRFLGYDRLSDLIVDKVFSRLKADRGNGKDPLAHRIRFTGFTLFEQTPILAAAIADETWGTAAGTAWTIAEGADNDWTITGERFGHDTSIDASGFGVMDNGSDFVSRTHATIDGVTADDFENQLTWQAQGGSDADGVGLIGRRSGSSTYYVAGYSEDNNGIFQGVASGDGIAIAKNVSGTVTLLGESLGALSNDTDFETKFRLEGTALKVKVWESAVSEPGTWDVEVTDSDLTGASAFGVAAGGKASDVFLFKNLVTDDLVSAGVSQVIGQAVDTSTAHPLSAVKTLGIGQAVEADLAQTVAAAKVAPIGQAVEATTAHPIASVKARAIGLALETDTAQTVTGGGQVTQGIGQAAETDTAQPLTTAKVMAIGQAVESDTAQPATAVATVAIGQALDTSLAQAVAWSKAARIGQATETDTAFAVTIFGVELEITAIAYYQFHRINGNLVLAPVGRSARRGYRTSEGFERVSDVIRIDQSKANDADVEAAMEAVASAWATHSGSDQATLKTAIHDALQSAGWRGQGGGDLT